MPSSIEVVQSKQGSLMSADSAISIEQVKTSSLGKTRATARSNELANLAVECSVGRQMFRVDIAGVEAAKRASAAVIMAGFSRPRKVRSARPVQRPREEAGLHGGPDAA